MRQVALFIALASTLISPTAEPAAPTQEQCYPDLPRPEVRLVSVEQYEVNGVSYDQYNLQVDNWPAYPNELFDPASDLAPCGSNTESSRTWVEIIDEDNNHVYGFCALRSSAELQHIHFGALHGQEPERDVRVLLVDRRCNEYYESNHLYLGGGEAYQVFVPGVVHWKGSTGSEWRTDVSIANLSGEDDTVRLSYYTSQDQVEHTSVPLHLPSGGIVEVPDVAVTFPELGSTNSGGALRASSRVPVTVTARTYSTSKVGTFGQFMPGVEREDGLTSGQLGLLQQLKMTARFRCNLGVVNLGSDPCDVEIVTHSVTGEQIGATRTVRIDPGQWRQDDQFLSVIGADEVSLAYATVRVLTPGGRAWAYASVIDNTTNDPVTIPLRIDRRSAPW